jgi:hypothetical protein
MENEEELKKKELELLNKEIELRKKEIGLSSEAKSKEKKDIESLYKVITVLSIFIVIVVIVFGFDLIQLSSLHTFYSNTTIPAHANSTSAPSTTPIINFTQLPAPELKQINDYPASDLIMVAKELLNGSINQTLPIASQTAYGLFPLSLSGKVMNNSLISNGKIDFYFGGQDACQFCGRDRWAIDIALTQFGSFKSLYSGYTYGDANYPTLFWTGNIQSFNNLQTQFSKYTLGNSYVSSKINFISADLYPLDGHGFYGPSVTSMESAYPQITPLFTNASKYDSVSVSSGSFGTPLEAVGNYVVNGAFTDVPIPYSSFQSIINSFYSMNTQFSLATIAGADMYIADFCHINNSIAPICSKYNWTAFYNAYG